MIEWTKSPVWLEQAFDAALPEDDSIERRQMFGYPAAFVGGNMATGLFGEQLIVRLSEERRAALLAEPGSAPFEPMPGRQMKEYVVVSPALVSDPDALKRWIGEAATYAASLPSRAKRAAEKAGKRTARKKVAKQAAKKVAKQASKKPAKAAAKRPTKRPTKKPTKKATKKATRRTPAKSKSRGSRRRTSTR